MKATIILFKIFYLFFNEYDQRIQLYGEIHMRMEQPDIVLQLIG